jgi:broad specificity phosphatase PhoE
MTRVLLVRHGDTAASKEERFAGASDIPLSKEGRTHAAELAVRLARYPIDAIYASSLQRARDTAGFIAQVHGMTVTPVQELREISHGTWDGHTRDEVGERYPGQLEEYDRDPFHFRPEGGECGEDVLQRSAPALADLVRRHPGQTVLIVAHKMTNRLLICHFVGIDPRQYREKLAQRPACLNILNFPNDREAQLLLLNDVGHYALSDSTSDASAI